MDDPSKDHGFDSAKISPPRGNRPTLRPRLFERLDQYRDRQITWIAGPPGAGKTTLTSSYLAAQGSASLWYQLDAGDADIATFFHYLGRAVQRAARPGRRALPPLTPEYLPSLMNFTRRYAEAVGACVEGPALIVLDNYEQVPAQAQFHQVTVELASSLPPGSRLIVLSRTEPPPTYARLRLNGQVALLDAQELDLTRDEALAIATARGSAGGDAVDATQIDRLLQQTHGWLAGFVLLLAEGREPARPGPAAKTQQLLFDYFATELFARFAPSAQAALMRSALLPSMTVASAEQICGDAAIGTLLADLQRQNCFIVERGQTATAYEFHALFRAFLLDRAGALIGADEWRTLQRRAAHLLAQSNQPDAAASLHRAAGDWQGLAALALREAPALVATGRHRTLQLWLDELPAELFQQAAWLHYWQAEAWLPFEAARARSLFEQAYAGFERSDDAVGLYSTWAGAMESFFYEWRDFRPADRWIAEFERLRARHPEFPSRAVELRTYWAMGTLLHRQPQHPLLPAWSERALSLLDARDRDLSVLIGGYLIIWFLWRGETARARGVIDRIVPWLDAEMSPTVFILWSCAVGLYHSVQGESEPCRAAIESGLDRARRAGLHNFDFLLCGQMARCALVAGDPAEAERWIGLLAGNMRSHSHLDGAFYRYMQCNAAAQRGDWALSLAHARGAMALESGVPFIEAHCHIDLARALLGLGAADGWDEHIQAARRIGQTIGSPVIGCLCLEAEAVAALRTGQAEHGQACLAEAMAASRAMGGATWRMAGAEASASLYDQALAAGIEVDHVRQMIRRQRLNPPDPATAAEAWPWPVRVYTLGRFEILLDDGPLRSSGKAQRKPLELLQCLCAFGGEAVDQDRVTDALWPDNDGDAADQALRTTLHRLRKLLLSDQAVRLENRQLHLDPRHVWADCLAVDRVAHHPGLQDWASLQRTLERYRGPFLPSESAPWVLAFRERLRTQTLRMAERLGALLEAAGDWPAAVDCYLRAIEVEPLAENFYRHLMASYARLDRRPEALLAYQRCRQTLLSRLGISPAPETQALHQRLASR